MARKHIIAGLVLVAIAVFSVPLAANAEGYAPGSSCSIAPSTVKGGQTSTFTCDPGTFADSESVNFVVSGGNAANASLASLDTSASGASISKLSSASGSVAAAVTVPLNATGKYELTATGASSKTVETATITVVPASDPATVTSGSSPNSGLADTGSVISMTLIWAAGGLIVLGIIVLIAVSAARRRHANS